MARGINKVILVGNLGNDPEIKYTQGGQAVATLSVATTRAWKDRDGNLQEKTEWHRVKLWGKTAEVAGEYLRKGRQIYIEGRLEYGSYDKDGVKHYTTDIIGEDMQMLGGGDRAEGGAPRRESSGGESRSPRPSQPAGGAPRREQAPAKASDFGADFADDDIPF